MEEWDSRRVLSKGMEVPVSGSEGVTNSRGYTLKMRIFEHVYVTPYPAAVGCDG
jgi:hypothetical protein